MGREPIWRSASIAAAIAAVWLAACWLLRDGADWSLALFLLLLVFGLRRRAQRPPRSVWIFTHRSRRHYSH